MQLTLKGLKNRKDWEDAGVMLPAYDVAEVGAATRKEPVWVHFGIGNIFRVFIGGIADQLIENGLLDRGITCIESYDYDVVDKIYKPYDNLALTVTLYSDGRREYKILGSMTEAIKAKADEPVQWNRLKEVFRTPGLQMVSFTITEKGYMLTKPDGTYFEFIQKDIENGPQKAAGAMAIVTAMLLERYQNGQAPLALVSMDNCSENGAKFRSAVMTIAKEWKERNFVNDDFMVYISDENKISFPWTMIDKITPRPSDRIAGDLKALGIEDMDPVITSKKTFIAPFVNAEKPQYLVIEDNFPNGRPEFEKVNVYMADRDTVNKSEKMKVTVCLNPIHTALGPYGRMLNLDLFAEAIIDSDLSRLASQLGYVEGMDVVPDPKILSPRAFLNELMNDRFPNSYLGDTCQRLLTDASQMVGIRFGITVKAHLEKYGNTDRLIAIPLAVAGWLRYLMGIDDEGNRYELSPDPMIEELHKHMEGIVYGNPDSVKDQFKWILSNENMFYVDMYQAGLGEKIEQMFREEIAGPGSVRRTLQKYLSETKS